MKLPHVNKKPLPRNRTIRAKKVHAAKPLAFSLHFLFRRDQNHHSNLTSKIMKMCEQILKKKTAPKYNSNSLNCKKTKRRPIIAPAIAVRLLKMKSDVIYNVESLVVSIIDQFYYNIQMSIVISSWSNELWPRRCIL